MLQHSANVTKVVKCGYCNYPGHIAWYLQGKVHIRKTEAVQLKKGQPLHRESVKKHCESGDKNLYIRWKPCSNRYTVYI